MTEGESVPSVYGPCRELSLQGRSARRQTGSQPCHFVHDVRGVVVPVAAHTIGDELMISQSAFARRAAPSFEWWMRVVW